MLKFFIHTIFISLLSFSGGEAKAQTPDSLFTAANKLYQQEKYIEALDQYQKIDKSKQSLMFQIAYNFGL